jgi:hypothetical protein
MTKQEAIRFVKDWIWWERGNTDGMPWYDAYILDVSQMLLDYHENPDRFKERNAELEG